MARALVGVVTTTGCPYCKQAKAALKAANVDCDEAQLSGDPDLLRQVKEVTGQRTVPQIFIGEEFVGGASDLLAIIEKGVLRERLEAAAGKAAFPPSIARVIQDHLPAPGHTDPAQAAAGFRATFDAEMPCPEGPAGRHQVRTVTAQAITDYLVSKGRDVQATVAGLLALRAIVPADPDAASRPFDPASTSQLFLVTADARAAPRAKGAPLNAHYTWHAPARPAVEVSGSLRGLILELYDAHLSPDGRAVDYAAMARDAAFAAYVDATAELQCVDLHGLSRAERIAFFVNVYNALIVHGTVALGSPSNLLKRLSFFGTCKYEIGGAIYSANDIEHGMLRDNAASPASVGALLGVPFLKPPQVPAGDPRLALRVSPLDPRIHFALVCGAKSCPPIKLYTPDNLEEGLQDAAAAFCAGEVEVETVSSTATVTMSKIFKWYGADFAAEERERLRVIAQFCPSETRAALLKLAESSGKVHLRYKPYDWSPNAK